MTGYKGFRCPHCGHSHKIRIVAECLARVSLSVVKGKLAIPDEFLKEPRNNDPSFNEDEVVLSLSSADGESRITVFGDDNCQIHCLTCKKILDLKTMLNTDHGDCDSEEK